jgi:hypothetical protein
LIDFIKRNQRVFPWLRAKAKLRLMRLQQGDPLRIRLVDLRKRMLAGSDMQIRLMR